MKLHLLFAIAALFLVGLASSALAQSEPITCTLASGEKINPGATVSGTLHSSLSDQCSSLDGRAFCQTDGTWKLLECNGVSLSCTLNGNTYQPGVTTTGPLPSSLSAQCSSPDGRAICDADGGWTLVECFGVELTPPPPPDTTVQPDCSDPFANPVECLSPTAILDCSDESYRFNNPQECSTPEILDCSNEQYAFENQVECDIQDFTPEPVTCTLTSGEEH